RQFTTSQVLLAAQHKQPKIRLPSKKSLAAKSRRRAAIANKLNEQAEKLSLMDAISVLRAVEVASPGSTYDLFIKTEMKKGVTVPKGRVTLPREAKPMAEEKIFVFAEGRQAEEAKKAGAHFIGGVELMDVVLHNRFQATTILCTTALIKAITPKLGRVLGPLGLMPSERRGTVTDDIAGYLQRIRGTSEWKADKSGNIHMSIAMMHFAIEDVVKNVRHFMSSVKRATGNMKEAEDSLTSITKVMLSSRQAPGIRISDY
ncbi:ribosomal protein L1, partial [Tricholoma matsutake]